MKYSRDEVPVWMVGAQSGECWANGYLSSPPDKKRTKEPGLCKDSRI